MNYDEEAKGYIEALKTLPIDNLIKQRIVSLVDLTSLNPDDKPADIEKLCQNAMSPIGHVAAVCTSIQFVPLTANQLAGTSVKIATVANFPSGNESLGKVLAEINQALESGAQEIDIVFPYTAYKSGDLKHAQTFVSDCKAACGDDLILKVILETGAIGELELIAKASIDIVEAGADFIKTSTGKYPIGATLEAASTMLLVLRDLKPTYSAGFKASGGIKTIEEAVKYVQLADEIMGREWVTPTHFRIGASKLMEELLRE